MSSIAVAQGCKIYVPFQVEQESLTIYEADKEDASKQVLVPIDIEEAVRSGSLWQCRIEGNVELDAFVRFAAALDDGEAACLAIALSREWTVATDDKKAIRLATSAGVPVITTPAIIKKWMDITKPTEEQIAEVIHRIERFAKFQPNRSNADYGWWIQLGSAS
jgi:predicted nucleic acid-binding protein